MNIGIICSSGGSPFFYAADILIESKKFAKENFFLITDRECGAELQAKTRGFNHARIEEKSSQKFSSLARDHFLTHNCGVVVLLFSRLVTSELFERLPSLNIHPSMLPQFPGMSAVKKAFEAKASRLGATLHLVDRGIDTGKIIAQVSTEISQSDTIEQLNRISFIQKTYLFLLGVETVSAEIVEAHPQLMDPFLRQGFERFQALMNVKAVAT